MQLDILFVKIERVLIISVCLLMFEQPPIDIITNALVFIPNFNRAYFLC